MMKTVGQWRTGSRRGYIHVSDNGVESELHKIPDTLKGLRGNKRWAMVALKQKGATHYTIAHFQGVPRKGYSNQYCYSVYYGYVM